MPVDYSLVAQGGDTRLGVSTVGTLVKVHANTTAVPTEYTITNEAAIAEDDETASLTASAACFIEKGTYLYFGADFIVAAESKSITTSATTLAIQPATATIADAATAKTYGLITLPTTDLPNNEEVGKVDAKTHRYGEQNAEERVSRAFMPSIPLIIEPGDRGFFYHAQPAALNKVGYNGTLNVAMAVPATNDAYEYTFGTALVTIDGDANPVNEIRRPSVNLSFQPPYLKTTLYDAESAAVKTAIAASCKLAGLPLPA
jgi:hypothetical protein